VNRTLPEFVAAAEAIRKDFPALESQHGYFLRHAARLHRACEVFGLFSGRLGDVLEIGPFYGYTPFLLRPGCASYSVLEGDDPVVHALEPVYQRYGIKFSYVDFFEIFGPTRTAAHALEIPDASYDTILCWETMEHFNFNPVRFVRELYRMLKPGGRVCITVPNKASFQAIAGLMTGRGEEELVNNFYSYENYISNGKRAYFGFHWREYSRSEMARLFARAGFKVQNFGTLVSFQDHGHASPARRLVRAIARVGATLFPRFGTHVFLAASK
jgi:SAM-dependent methyltransferase